MVTFHFDGNIKHYIQSMSILLTACFAVVRLVLYLGAGDIRAQYLLCNTIPADIYWTEYTKVGSSNANFKSMSVSKYRITTSVTTYIECIDQPEDYSYETCVEKEVIEIVRTMLNCTPPWLVKSSEDTICSGNLTISADQ